MPRITFKGDESLDQLTERLFQFKRASAVERARAREELLAANPHLRDYTRVPAGAPVLVPDLPEITPTAESQPLDTQTDEFFQTLERMLADSSAFVERTAEHNVEIWRGTVAGLKTPRPGRGPGRGPNEPGTGTDPQKEAQLRLDQAQMVQERQRRAFEQLNKDMAVLRQLAENAAGKVLKQSIGDQPPPVDRPSKPNEPTGPIEPARPVEPARPGGPTRPHAVAPAKPAARRPRTSKKKK